MLYLIILIRVFTVLTVFLLVALMLSKRHMGRFTIFDFIAAVTLGAVAGADIADINKPHAPRIFALLCIGVMHVLFTKLILENRKMGKLLTFDPTLVIQNGNIVVDNLRNVRFTLDDLLSLLREHGIFDLNEVEFAILEPNGKLSVLKKSQHMPVTPSDMNISTEYKGLSAPLILEGKILKEGLKSVGLNENWLSEQLAVQGIKSVEDVFLALLNSRGKLYISRYDEPQKLQRLDH